MTSPPYWGLRDYKTEPVTFPDGWVGQLGLEPTPQLYIKHLVSIFDEVKRALKPSGTCWVNLGDSYFSSTVSDRNGLASKTGFTCGATTKEHLGFTRLNGLKRDNCGIQDKCLVQIPSRFALAMTDNGWILRNEVIWHKPNCMPSSVKDRFTVDFEKLFFFVKSKRYYFEPQYEPMAEASESRYDYAFGGAKNEHIKATDNPTYVVGNRTPTNGRNKRTVWTISTKPYSGAHFAVFPPELIETPIKAGCPDFICSRCGKAREKQFIVGKPVQFGGAYEHASRSVDSPHRQRDAKMIKHEHIDAGYSDCGCGAPFVPGVVLDPFGGSGTTAKVARSLGRSSIIIELNPAYLELATERAMTNVPDVLSFADRGAGP